MEDVNDQTNTHNNDYALINNNNKVNNWPKCKPIIRHDIRSDIPPSFQILTWLMFSRCFYISFFLFFNFITVLLSYYVFKVYPHDDVIEFDLILSPIWFVVWTLLSFLFYSFMYKAFSYKNTKYFITFIVGSVIEIIFSIIAALGFTYFGIMGLFMASSISKYPGACAMSWVVTTAFMMELIFLVVIVIIIITKFAKMKKAEKKNINNVNNDSNQNMGSDEFLESME